MARGEPQRRHYLFPLGPYSGRVFGVTFGRNLLLFLTVVGLCVPSVMESWYTYRSPAFALSSKIPRQPVLYHQVRGRRGSRVPEAQVVGPQKGPPLLLLARLITQLCSRTVCWGEDLLYETKYLFSHSPVNDSLSKQGESLLRPSFTPFPFNLTVFFLFSRFPILKPIMSSFHKSSWENES